MLGCDCYETNYYVCCPVLRSRLFGGQYFTFLHFILAVSGGENNETLDIPDLYF